MAELLRSLQDSQLVARFQRRCGLFPAPEDNPRENSPGPSEGTTRVPEVAHLPANPQAYVEKHVVKNYFYYYLFRFSAALGQEVFYITFLPFTHWNIDPYLSRRLVMIWVVSFKWTIKLGKNCDVVLCPLDPTENIPLRHPKLMVDIKRHSCWFVFLGL